jgi:hypothetical protein
MKMLDEIFNPVKAVLIGVERNDVVEIDLDISSKKSQVTQYLGGRGTFVGQWIERDIVIMKCMESIFDLGVNNNKLAEPFDREVIIGPILLVRMDENSEPKDLTLKEVQESMLVLPKRLRRISNQ